MVDPRNEQIAVRLEEMAALLESQAANRFRVGAYRRAAAIVRRLPRPAAQILQARGTAGLEQLRGIGPGIARAIRDIVTHGYSPMLERLRGESDPVRLFRTVPGIGPRIAARLHDDLGLDTLADLEAAAHDGRLETIAGFGAKRLAGVRDTLARRLDRVTGAPGRAGRSAGPGVAELLDVDREYREQADAGALRLIAPRRFNPERRAWLPILHTERGGRHYTALFSNTARAHRLGQTRDWVVLYCDNGAREHQWTVITAAFGPLRGRRIVRGHEDECLALYRAASGRRSSTQERGSREAVPHDPAPTRRASGSRG